MTTQTITHDKEQTGPGGVPASWRKRLNRQEEIHALVERIVARAG